MFMFLTPKTFSGHVEFSFDNPADTFSIKVRKCFANNRKIYVQKTFRKFLLKCSSRHEESRFGSPVENHFREVRKFLARSTKKLLIFQEVSKIFLNINLSSDFAES